MLRRHENEEGNTATADEAGPCPKHRAFEVAVGVAVRPRHRLHIASLDRADRARVRGKLQMMSAFGQPVGCFPGVRLKPLGHPVLMLLKSRVTLYEHTR